MNAIVDFLVVAMIVTYFANVVVLNTSIGLRMGYNPWRVGPLSFFWPLLELYPPLKEWAKGGECTLPEDHPLRD